MQIPIFRGGGCVKKVKLDKLGKIITGNTPSKKILEFYDSNDIPFIKPDDFKTIDEISSSKGNKNYISENARNNARIVPQNSVLVTCIGIIGKVMISESELSFNQQINAIVPNELILSKYLAYLLLYNKSKLDFISNAPVVPIINKTQFSEFEVTFHENIDVQEMIIQKLENLDNQILKRRHQSKLLSNLVKSRFNEMFILSDFSLKRLGELVDEVRYGTSLPATINGKYGYLRMNNITENGKLNIQNLKYIDIPEKDLEKYVVRKGDILFNRTNSIELVGKTCIYELDFDMVIAGYIIRIRTNNNILNPRYLSEFLNFPSTKKFLRNIAKGAVNQANINAKELQDISIPLPPLDLQNEFADFVAQVDKSQFACQIVIKLWRNSLKSSII